MRHLIKLYEDFRRAVELSQRSGKKGFSLIELLVVIAIIAILAAIAIPQYNKYRANAMLSSVQSLNKDLVNLAMGLAQTLSQNPIKECRYADHIAAISQYGKDETSLSNGTCNGPANKKPHKACYIAVYGEFNGKWSSDPCDRVAIWDENKKVYAPQWVEAVNASLDFIVNGTNIQIENNKAYTVVESAYKVEGANIGCAFLPANDTMCDVDDTYICRTGTNVAAPCKLSDLLQ